MNTIRSIRDLRLAGLIAYVAALIAGLIGSGLVHLLSRGQGRFGWEGINFAGFLEGLVFLLLFTLSLWIGKRAVRVTATTLLSAGLFIPTPARKLAKPVQTVDNLEDSTVDLAILTEGGAPVGVIGLGENIVPWEQVAVVSSQAGAYDLGILFQQHPMVFVADGNTVHGVIRRDGYFRYLGVK
jgi:hypothetical protein